MSDLTQWNYKRSHSITSGTTLTDYQVKIRVYRTEGTSTGDTVYLGSKCLADYGDIRFVASDNTTELPYWMETNAVTYADFWVKVPSISDTTIWIYYGNSSATTTSNGDTTFPFFDDFTSNTIGTKWTLSGSNHQISNGELQSKYFDASAIPKYVKSNTTFNPNTHALRYRHKGNPPADGNEIIGFYYSDTRWGAVAINPYNGSGDRAWDWSICCDNSPWGTTGGDGTLSVNTYYIIDLYKTSSTNYQAKINDSTIGNVTCANQDSNHNIGFCAWDSVASYTFFTDWVLVRKYTASEPTHVSWSEEQEVTSYPLKITITPTSGTYPLSVTYNLSISDPLDDFTLNYGDGNVYTADDVTSFSTTHIYDTPGTYTVWAEGYNEFATHVFYEIPYGVNVSAQAVTASFTVDQTYNIVQFTNTSTGSPNEFFWTFGDGTVSYEASPIHTYHSAATYPVTLYASNQYQYSNVSNDITITQVLTPPQAFFVPNEYNIISPSLPYSITFTNLSTPTFGCTYNWLIDGTSYTTQDASHSFPSVGMYDVGLTVTNALGSATKTYTDAIRITRKGKTFYEVINYADTPATFHVEVFNEVATSADTVIQAHIFDESINFVQDEVPDEPGLDEWGMRHFYSSINEWGHRIISAVTDWGNRILYNGSTLDNSPVTLFKAQEFREDVVFIDEWQFGTT